MKKRVLILKITASILFFGVLLFRIRWRDLGRVFLNVEPAYVAVSFLISFGLVASSCWKWWAILRLQGHRLPFGTLYRWYFIGYLYSNFLPSNIGGDLARSWFTGRRIGSHEASLVAVFAERFTGMVFLLLIVIVAPFLNTPLRGRMALAIPALAAFLLLAGIAVIPVLVRSVHRSRYAERWSGIARRLLRVERSGRPADLWIKLVSRIESFAGQLEKFFAVLRAKPRAFWSITALTALFYVLTVLNVVVACRAFGVWAKPTAVATVLPAALLVASLPITLGSLGLAEGSYVFYLGLIGLSGEVTLAMAMLLRLKIIFLGLIGLAVQACEPGRPPPHPVPSEGICLEPIRSH